MGMAAAHLSLLIFLPLIIAIQQSPPAASQTVSLAGCRSKCGGITVPYPYGFEPGCFRDMYYELVCNETYSPARLFVGTYEVVSISTGGQLQISVPAKRACYNSTGDLISTTDTTSATTYIALGDLYLMSVSNSFFAIGCPNLGYFVDGVGYYVSGCFSGCRASSYALIGTTNGSCTGVGCCQSSIPKGLSFYEPYLSNIPTTSAAAPEIRSYTTNCSYVFLADSDWFKFNDSYLSRTEDFRVQVGLDWAIRNVANCTSAKRNASDYACKSANSACYSPDNGAGYLCKCSEGYQGNPYIAGGCQDIDECELKDEYPCYGVCENTIGSYTCTPMVSVGTKVSLPGCRSKCGDITVPYPYGFEPNCFREEYKLVCNETYSPARLFVRGYEVVSISTGGQLQISVPAKRFCYNSTGELISSTDSTSTTYIGLGDLYLISVSNSFFAIGCPNLGYFVDAEGYYVNGCLSGCQAPGFAFSGTTNGSCTRVGWCQSSIPKGLSFYEPYLSNIQTTSAAAPEIRSYTTNCSYVFLANSDWFKFNDSYLSRTDDFRVQVGLDWAIRNVANCTSAKRNASDYACKSVNSECYSADNGAGYLCKCSEGYRGNPYIAGGCQDINECELKDEYPCYGCENTIGNYTCTCPSGTHGNARIKDGCQKKDGFTLAVKIVIGASVGAFIVAFSCFWLYLAMQKRRLIRAKQRFFEQNGGVLLQQQMKSFKTRTFKIYTQQELEKATDKFSEERVLGRGGHGIVYKGILEDGTIAAIKKSKIMEEHETQEFAKEMMILSQINHKNVVKLLGCCLEVEVPMLVYEYISNGTLYHYMHKNSGAPVPAIERLRIAAESADALAYMHSSASPPILHGDVKTANILLDDKFMAKVSDFGASKLAPNDEAEIATLVQGTCGYLDPEYLLTCQLTDKSDVYSFAVIILELLTKKKALYFEGPDEDRSLASSFCVAKKEGRFVQILDAQVRDELKPEVIEEIGDLVMHCLNMNREERPTMREVADTLERARRFQKESGAVEKSLEETESLLGDSIDVYTRDSSMSYSFAQEAIMDMLQGRRRL